MSAGGSRRGQPDAGDLEAVLGEIDASVRALLANEDPERALEKAVLAHEEYDYELARNLYKLAVLYSGGEAEMVCRLATFLVDDYAIFDEAIRILQSQACEDSAEGKRLLARAHELAGNSTAALETLRQINLGGLGDTATWTQQGSLLLHGGEVLLAREALQRALALHSGNVEASRLLARCKESLAREIAPLLARAREALEQERTQAADSILREAADGPHLPSEYHRLRAQVDRRLDGARLEALLDQGSSHESAGEAEAALASYRGALGVDPSCELARDKVAELEAHLERDAGQTWLGRGNAALGKGDLEEAVHGYYMAVTRDSGIEASSADGVVLFELVREFRQEVGKVPDKAQAAALAALFRGHRELEQENLPGCQMEMRRAGSVADLLPTGRSIQQRLQALEQAGAHQRARNWMAQAEAEEKAGRVEEAIALYERVARAQGLAEAAKCAERARSLRSTQSTGRQRVSALASLEGLVAEQHFFLALREMTKNQTLLAGEPQLEELQEAARQGTQTKYPMKVDVLSASVGTGSRFRSEPGTEFLPATSRMLQAAPGSSEWVVVSGRALLILDALELRAKLSVELPPQADLTDKKGFVLSDLVPGDRAGIVVVNFDDDLLLYFHYRRSQFDLVNVLPLERFLQQSRRKVTRWYTLNGPEEQLVVCQAPQGGGGDTRIYGLSLMDGRILHDDEFGYALSNLRRIPGEGARYVIHRMPEPMLMRRPGYFSLMFMDGRLRVQDRLNIGPEELEGTFVESTRWFRQGPRTGRRYFFFRYFDSYTGQLVSQPLAFVAMGSDGELAYAATDSSTLVRNEGDLEAIGEIFLHEGREVMAMLGRKESEPLLFVVDLESFRVLKKHSLAQGRRYVGMANTEVPGKLVLISLHTEDGDVQMETLEVL